MTLNAFSSLWIPQHFIWKLHKFNTLFLIQISFFHYHKTDTYIILQLRNVQTLSRRLLCCVTFHSQMKNKNMSLFINRSKHWTEHIRHDGLDWTCHVLCLQCCLRTPGCSGESLLYHWWPCMCCFLERPAWSLCPLLNLLSITGPGVLILHKQNLLSVMTKPCIRYSTLCSWTHISSIFIYKVYETHKHVSICRWCHLVVNTGITQVKVNQTTLPRNTDPVSLASSSPPPLEKMLLHSLNHTNTQVWCQNQH